MLEVESFSVRYHSVVALNNVSLRVEEGQVTTVIGPNGAGKTSLVNAIMGLHVYSGTLRFPFAPDATRTTEARVKARIALVPESRDLFGQMSVLDNLRLGAYVHRYHAREKREERLKDVFNLFPRLRERKTQLAYTLSGGERQMLALGRALLLRPRLLMLDEPSLGLAPLIVVEIFRIIESLKKEGVSILLIEQNARAALKIADHAYVIENGAVTLSGKAQDIVNDPRVMQSYLGLNTKNS
jgi:branched-chain amino acid transport system ATP-binding protein